MNVNIEKIATLSSDGRVMVYGGDAPEVFQYHGFQYEASTVKGFVELVKKKGVQERAVVFGSGKCFHAILDDAVQDRELDTVTMPFEHSVICKEWLPILQNGMVMNQKQFVDFLKRRSDGEIENIDELLYNIKNFKYVTSVSGDFTYDSRNNYTFAVKVQEAEGTVRIPQSFIMKCEIFKGSGWEQMMEIELEIQKPKDQGEALLFQLTCPKFPRYIEDAKEQLFDSMKRELDGWLVVEGSAKN